MARKHPAEQWAEQRRRRDEEERQSRVMVITEFDAGDPEATLHALADEILRYRRAVGLLAKAIGWADAGAPWGTGLARSSSRIGQRWRCIASRSTALKFIAPDCENSAAALAAKSCARRCCFTGTRSCWSFQDGGTRDGPRACGVW